MQECLNTEPSCLSALQLRAEIVVRLWPEQNQEGLPETITFLFT